MSLNFDDNHIRVACRVRPPAATDAAYGITCNMDETGALVSLDRIEDAVRRNICTASLFSSLFGGDSGRPRHFRLTDACTADSPFLLAMPSLTNMHEPTRE